MITVTAPADVTVEATGTNTTVELGTATYVDASGLSETANSITSDAPATFTVGTHTVT